MGRQATYNVGDKIGNRVVICQVQEIGRAYRLYGILCMKCGKCSVTTATKFKSDNCNWCKAWMVQHGLRYSRAYETARNVIARCGGKSANRSRNKCYAHVSVHAEWRKSPGGFAEYIRKLPGYDNPLFTLDRINPRKGYEPGNLRWADDMTQDCNKRKYGGFVPTSPFMGSEFMPHM